MNKVVIGLAVLLALGAGGAWLWSQQGTTAMIKKRVLKVLNDPSSAEFKVVEHNLRHGTGCGFVNAKNRMGGMVGFTPFIAFPDGDVRFRPAIGQARNLAESLQVAFDAGAKRILLPMSSVTDIPSVPGELFAKFQTSFYSDPVDAVFKALGVE